MRGRRSGDRLARVLVRRAREIGLARTAVGAVISVAGICLRLIRTVLSRIRTPVSLIRVARVSSRIGRIGAGVRLPGVVRAATGFAEHVLAGVGNASATIASEAAQRTPLFNQQPKRPTEETHLVTIWEPESGAVPPDPAAILLPK
jgi:hypothetical protein